MGAWGVGPGCYLVLPVLGPTTLRDAAGSFVNVLGGDPWYNASSHGNNEFLSDQLYLTSKALNGINFRAENMTSLENLETNSVDFYATVKSLYSQDRENKIKNSQRGIDMTKQALQNMQVNRTPYHGGYGSNPTIPNNFFTTALVSVLFFNLVIMF